MRLTGYEKRNYVMKDKNDFVILSKIRKLEKRKLGRKEREMIKLVRTQLKRTWRAPLIRHLDKMLKSA